MSKNKQPKRQIVALEALRQNMALIKKGLEVRALHPDGSTEVLSRSKDKADVWRDALSALQSRSKSGQTDIPHRTVESIKIYSDGGSRGNPGQSAAGYVILTDDESHALERGGQYLGITTNNQAEYQAVKLALEAASKFQPSKIDFFVDSLLVANQLNGIFRVKNKELWPVHSAIKELAKQFDEVKFSHVRREHNQMADDEVNKILDAQESGQLK